MSLYVVDASVVIKWYIPEVLSDKAEAFLERAAQAGDALLAPDFLLAELANILWKKQRRRELQEAEVRIISDKVLNHLGVHLVGTKALIAEALAVAGITGCSLYDALYVAAAELYNTTLITADEKLVRALSAPRFAGRVVFLGSLLRSLT